MKSKAPLALMEQLMMILVFALAAALCLQLFVLSNTLSRDGETRDQAVTAVQNAAETLKANDGSFEALAALRGGVLTKKGCQIGYDDNWQVVPVEKAAFVVTAESAVNDQPLLGSAIVTVKGANGKEWFQITIGWQEKNDE